MHTKLHHLFCGLFLFLLAGCVTGDAVDVETEPCTIGEDKRFSLISCDPASGIDFRNDLTYTDALNPYTYRNFYNGGGVGLGDFNGDGLLDIYLTGNLVDNKLYLNRGDFRFEDVTAAAGVGCPDTWSTGVAVVDIDLDGDLDLYVCKAGPPAGEEIAGMTGVRHNELFLNNGDATFREASAEYGLDVVGLSVHSAFFDYDADGDLDCYLLNNSTRSTTGYDFKEGLRDIPDPEGGNKLLRNDGGTFTEVTQQAGIYSSAIGFGLGVTVGDVDGDHLPDLFVSNDFFERDYLYFNNGDGTFREALTDHLPEISQGSMGADFADLNNDGLPELFVTEMLPRTDYRRKTKASFNGWNKYQMYRDRGYHQQFSRNVLQLNRGGGRFSEVSRMMGVDATEWSWGALLADLDNDGFRDILVANGNGKDLLDQDYINFDGSQSAIRAALQEGKTITDIIDKIPAERQANGVFRNQKGTAFEDVAEAWGLDRKTFSNGAAYGDLDNDGDLDLVINNIDDLAGVYRNNSASSGLTLHLRPRPQTTPIGTKIYAKKGSTISYTEVQPMRGFQSTVAASPHLGFVPDAVLIRWSDGTWEEYVGSFVQGGALLKQGKGQARAQDAVNGYWSDVRSDVALLRQRDLSHLRHQENPVTQYDRHPLQPFGIGNEGPAFALGNPFNDGTQCGFLGGGPGQPGQFFLVPGKYVELSAIDLSATVPSENVDAVWFDANGDGRDDLYVVNGGPQFGRASTQLADQLYLSAPSRKFRLSEQVLPSPSAYVVGSCARPHDVDGDGDLDLFVGGRMRPGLYGVPTDSYLLINDGTGKFATQAIKDLGMVTDAAWVDMDGDGDKELAIARDWGTLAILSFNDPSAPEIEEIPNSAGLWRTLAVANVVGELDSLPELIVGNYGLNTCFTASPKAPLELHVNDFDGNGQAEQIVVQTTADGKRIPVALRDDLVKQMPGLRKRIPRYSDYGSMTFDSLFSAEIRGRSVVSHVDFLQSMVVTRGPNGYRLAALPNEAQLSPIYAIAVADLNGDGRDDLLTGGNQTVGKPETGVNAASFGMVFLNLLPESDRWALGRVGPAETGMILDGDVRKIITINNRKFAVARSNGTVLELQFEKR